MISLYRLRQRKKRKFWQLVSVLAGVLFIIPANCNFIRSYLTRAIIIDSELISGSLEWMFSGCVCDNKFQTLV